MTSDQSEMLIRHDEQLKTLAPLPAAVQKLADKQNSLSAKVGLVVASVSVAGMIINCLGTWYILIHFSK